MRHRDGRAVSDKRIVHELIDELESGSVTFPPSGTRPDSPIRSVLVICYDYPGIYAAGVIRTYQIAKNLLNFGWRPVILTAQACIDRVDNIETSDGALQCPKITAAASRFLVPSQINHRTSPAVLHEEQLSARKGVWKDLRRLAVKLAVPDGKIGWLYSAVKRGLEIARVHPVRICFSVSPRPTAHLVAYRLARKLKIPWVADFALPWSDAHWLRGRPGIIEWLDQRIEGLVVRAAHHVSVAYPDLEHSMCSRYGLVLQDKITAIPAGFDDDVFTEASPSSTREFTVVYPGNHFCEPGRYGEYFLEAIDQWVDLDPSLEECVKFVFVGKRDEVLLRKRAAMVHSKAIRIEPLMSHRACIQTILSSHMCVVNTIANRVPAKVYECMRADKWILALTDPDSDLAAILRGYSKSVVVRATNTAAIRQALQNVWQLVRTQVAQPIKIDLSLCQYSAKHSAELLASIFDRISHAYHKRRTL